MTDNNQNTVEIAMYEFKDFFDFIDFSLRIQEKKQSLPVETLFQVATSVYNKAIRKFVVGASADDIELVTIPDSIYDMQDARRYIAHLNSTDSIMASRHIDEEDFQEFAKNEIKLYFSKLGGIKSYNDKSVFGKIAFAPNREDIPDEMYEHNTVIESDVFEALHHHIANNIKIPKSISIIIKNILRKGKYSDMFVKPKTEYIYRGMRLRENSSDKIKQSSNFVFCPRAVSLLLGLVLFQ